MDEEIQEMARIGYDQYALEAARIKHLSYYKYSSLCIISKYLLF